MTDPIEPAEPANLRFLRRLVTGLTATMLIGFVILVGVLVTRLSSSGPTFPETVTLPDGLTAAAYTHGKTWYAIVTTDDQILIYNRADNTLRQTIAIK